MGIDSECVQEVMDNTPNKVFAPSYLQSNPPARAAPTSLMLSMSIQKVHTHTHTALDALNARRELTALYRKSNFTPSEEKNVQFLATLRPVRPIDPEKPEPYIKATLQIMVSSKVMV